MSYYTIMMVNQCVTEFKYSVILFKCLIAMFHTMMLELSD